MTAATASPGAAIFATAIAWDIARDTCGMGHEDIAFFIETASPLTGLALAEAWDETLAAMRDEDRAEKDDGASEDVKQAARNRTADCLASLLGRDGEQGI